MGLPGRLLRVPARSARLFRRLVWDSAVDTVRTVFRRRDGGMRALILVQIFIYACYRFASANFSLTYLYMKRWVPPFNNN